MACLLAGEYHNALFHGTHECHVCLFERLENFVVPEELTQTNDPLSNQVLSSLLASLDTVRSVSEDIDKCIVSLETMLSRIQSAKARCVLSVHQHKAAMHPIRSIPDDILLEIFKWSQAISKDRLPWTVSHVSRRWRALALSSPPLWSTIDIQRQSGPDSKWNLVIQRSMDSDLSIHLHRKVGRVDDLVLLLPPTTNRWRRVVISNGTSFISSIKDSSFDRLTHLVFIGNPSYAERSSMFMRAPNLLSVTLYGQANIDLLWDRITTYSCSPYGIRYLHKCIAVEHLSLDFVRATTSRISPLAWVPVTLHLPMLRSLSISQHEDTSPTILDISKHLYIPSLTTLTISSGSRPLPRFPEPPLHLRELCIGSRAPELSAFLATYTSITSLHARTVDVLKLLPVIAGHPFLLPNLTSLCIDGGMLYKNPQLIVEILGSRCDGRVARLNELRISKRNLILQGAKDFLQTHVMPGERWNNVCSKVKIVDIQCLCDELK